jgi:hypothetical protein
MAHIRGHSSDDIEAAKANLELEGFLVEVASRIGTTVRVVCPVCRGVTTDTMQFIQHLATEHLYASKSGGYLNFEQWKAYWNENTPKLGAAKLRGLLPWSPVDDFLTFDRKRDYQCPSCSFCVRDVGKSWGPDGKSRTRKHSGTPPQPLATGSRGRYRAVPLPYGDPEALA